MSSLPPISEMSILTNPGILNRAEDLPSPVDGFIYAICPMCAKIQDDVLVSKKIRAQKMIFCSTNCQMIFQTNVIKITSKKDINELRLGHTMKPENKDEEEYLKMTKEKIERNW